MQAYLVVGGIPEYLLKLKMDSSILLSLSQQTFIQNSYFLTEYEKIFVSSLSGNENYKKIIEFLAKRKFSTRQEILKHLKVSSGKNITNLLRDLELCGFIEKYTPYSSDQSSLLARYSISDQYLQFYFKFVNPITDDITKGKFNNNPLAALNSHQYQIWLGFAFERFCRKYAHVIANILGFKAVQYVSGAFYNRATGEQESGFQIDLLFDRFDNVITICEIKYLKNPVKKDVINEFERKLERFPLGKNKTLHKVLISVSGAEASLIESHYFDAIITLDDLMNPHYW